MGYPVSCSCGSCAKCKHREYSRKARAKKKPSILIKRGGKGRLKLEGKSSSEDSSFYYGPSFPGSTLDPNRIFILREADDK